MANASNHGLSFNTCITQSVVAVALCLGTLLVSLGGLNFYGLRASSPVNTARPDGDLVNLTADEKWLRLAVDGFLHGSVFRPKYGVKEVTTRSYPAWQTEFDRRSKKRTVAQREALAEKARFTSRHLAAGLRQLESLGYHPVLRDGALIAALRHSGWIDFGGSSYQTGYDMDPDALLLADEAAELNDNPTSVAPYVWRPYLTFEQFVHRHCDRPSETVKFFAQTLGLNVSQPRGGTLYYNGTLVADFANRFRWKRPGTLYPQCWRHLAGSKPAGSYAMLFTDEMLFPTKHIRFYDEMVPVPNHALHVSQKQWGNDIMKVLRIKNTAGRGDASEAYAIDGLYAPAVPLGPCEPNTVFRSEEWYSEYAWHVRMVRPDSVCPVCAVNGEANPPHPLYGNLPHACERWWHPRPHHFDSPLRKYDGNLRSSQQTVPRCTFGQASAAIHKTNCTPSVQTFITALESLRVSYFPRSKTELDIVSGSHYSSDDDDIEIYVDLPPVTLYYELQAKLNPPPRLSGSGATTEVHWHAGGCPNIRIVYNDWISDELQQRAQPSDLCTCKLRSVELRCHRDGPNRMYAQYGPIWMVPLSYEVMGVTQQAFTNLSYTQVKTCRSKLEELADQTSGVIGLHALRKLMRTSRRVQLLPNKLDTAESEPLILAQLNALYNRMLDRL